jgi:hypothetical protein
MPPSPRALLLPPLSRLLRRPPLCRPLFCRRRTWRLFRLLLWRMLLLLLRWPPLPLLPPQGTPEKHATPSSDSWLLLRLGCMRPNKAAEPPAAAAAAAAAAGDREPPATPGLQQRPCMDRVSPSWGEPSTEWALLLGADL